MGISWKGSRGFSQKVSRSCISVPEIHNSSLQKLMRIQIHQIRFLLELSDFHFQNFLGLGMYVLITADFLEEAFTYSDLQATSIILKSSSFLKNMYWGWSRERPLGNFLLSMRKITILQGATLGELIGMPRIRDGAVVIGWDCARFTWNRYNWIRLCMFS